MTTFPSTQFVVPAVLGAALGLAATLLAAAADLSYRTHWLGHAGTEIPAQTSAQGLAVAADGTCIVSSAPGAGPPVVAFYRDGRIVGHAATPASGGHAFTGAVAASEQLIFAAGALDHAAAASSATAGLGTMIGPPPGKTWHGLWRWTRDGQPAPFAEGRGNDKSFLFIHETPATPDSDPGAPPGIAGLWIIAGLWNHQGELFVSDTAADRIRVYDETTMTEKRSFGADRPSGLCVLGGGLQIIERGAVVSAFTLDGRRTGQVLDEGDDLIPGAVAPTPEGRLLVSDLGTSQQVHLFNMSGVPTRVRTLGDELGLYGPPTPGTAGPRRFAGLTGVGADAAGHLYVAMNPPPGGFVLRSFGTDRKTLHWQLAALALRQGADVDPSGDGLEFLSAEGRHALDLSQPPGQSWRWLGQSVNPFRYPNDPRLLPRTATLEASAKTSPQGGTTTFCEIEGHQLLAIRSSGGSLFSLYRLQGQTAVPALIINAAESAGAIKFNPPGHPKSGPWIWRDTNGDGLSESAEFAGAPAFVFSSFQNTPIDTRGGLWSTRLSNFYRLQQWPTRRIDERGIPVYEAEPAASASTSVGDRTGLRIPFDSQYDPASDVVYQVMPAPRDSTGSLLAVGAFGGWSKTRDPDGPPGTVRWMCPLPPSFQSGAEISLALAGNLLFVLHDESREIHVYEAATGTALGPLKTPDGPEAVPASTPSPALRAHRRRDGTYLVLVQDRAAPRVLVYHLEDPLKGVTGQ